MSAGLRPATAREPLRAPADQPSARPRTAMAPAEYLKAHKIRDKLYNLTRTLAIYQPHNPADFLIASQHAVERDSLHRASGSSRCLLPHERVSRARSSGARDAEAGVEPVSLLVELEHNATSLVNLSRAVQPHMDNGFAQFHSGDSQTNLVGALRHFLLANAAAGAEAQTALFTLIKAGVPTSRQGYLRSLPEAFARPQHSDAEAEQQQLARDWDAMCQEYVEHAKTTTETPPNYADALEKYGQQIFPLAHARTHTHTHTHAHTCT